ncbi:MAG: class I SAM-dependent methyltransferase [Gammaproteobacteria bacterium]
MNQLLLTPEDMADRRYDCPVCHCPILKTHSRVPYLDVSLQFDFCINCNLVFMNPHPTQAWYDRLYGDEFWEVKSQLKSGSTVDLNINAWRKSLKRSQKLAGFLERSGHTPPIGDHLLEVGSAYGLIVSDLARRFKCSASGVEPNHKARAFSDKYTDVSSVAESMAGLADWDGSGTVDMMVFSHVLENIVDLNATFATIRQVLNPNGHLLIETPNIYLPRATHIYHPYCFCKTSLHALLAAHRFEIEHIETSGAPRTVMSPQYITVLARPIKTDKKQKLRYSHLFPEDEMRLGHIWFAIAARHPLKLIDALISRRRYELDQAAEDRLAALKATATVNSGAVR